MLGVPSSGVHGAKHSAEVSQHSQLLPDHVDLDNLDDDLDGLFDDSMDFDAAED